MKAFNVKFSTNNALLSMLNCQHNFNCVLFEYLKKIFKKASANFFSRKALLSLVPFSTSFLAWSNSQIN